MENGINLFDDINGKEIKTKKSFKKTVIKGFYNTYKFCFKYRRCISLFTKATVLLSFYFILKKIFTNE